MPSPLTRVFYILLICLLLPAQAQAESLTLTFGKSAQVMHMASGAAPAVAAQSGAQTIILYPSAFSSQNGKTEHIYDFANKTLTVVNHADKTYIIYPLHSVPIVRANEHANRIRAKLAMYQQHAANMQIPVSTLSQDIDIDMMMASQRNQKTGNKIATQKVDNKTTYTSGQNTLAVMVQSTDKIPGALRKTYTHFIIYELAVHPVIKQAIAAEENLFKSIEFTNRDMFKNISVNFGWTLESAVEGTRNAPAIPADYVRTYHSDKAVDQAFKASLTPRPLDDAVFQARIDKLIDQTRYLDVFLSAQVEELAKHEEGSPTYKAAIAKATKVGQSFERAVYLSIIQTPENPRELKQYKSFLENAKKRAPDYAWLLDYYIALHTRAVMGKKEAPNKYELQQLTQSNKVIVDTLVQLPQLADIYQLAGDIHFTANDIPTAFVYWSHLTELLPNSEGALNLAKMKADTERNFPEYF